MRALSSGVVPAKAGTHSHRLVLLKRNCATAIGANSHRHGVWVPAFAGTTPLFSFRPPAKTKSPGWRPGFFWDAGMVDQAAGLNSFDALALIGSTVSAATFWLNSASSLAWAVTASYCFLACEVHSSIASEGDLTPSNSCAKSSVAVVLAFIISISLAEYSL